MADVVISASFAKKVKKQGEDAGFIQVIPDIVKEWGCEWIQWNPGASYECSHGLLLPNLLNDEAKAAHAAAVKKMKKSLQFATMYGGKSMGKEESVDLDCDLMEYDQVAQVWECNHGVKIPVVVMKNPAEAATFHATALASKKPNLTLSNLDTAHTVMKSSGMTISPGTVSLTHEGCGGEVDQTERYGAHCQECGPVPASEIQTAAPAVMKSGFSTAELCVAASKKADAPILKQMSEAAIAAKMAADAEGVFDGMTKATESIQPKTLSEWLSTSFEPDAIQELKKGP